MTGKVVSLPIRRCPNERSLERKTPDDTCQHYETTYYYSEAENDVTCGRCGAKLNPIWVMNQLAMHESLWIEGRRRYLQLKAEHERRRSCKCQHCGRMTRIRGM